MATIQPTTRNIEPQTKLSIVVTGGLGCVGLAVTKCLLARISGAKIHILDVSLPASRDSFSFSEEIETNPFVEYHKVNVTDYASTAAILQTVKPQVVIHTAGLVPNAARQLGFGDAYVEKVNVDGTRNVLNAARDAGVKAFVLTSSCDVVKRNSWKDLINVSERPDDLDETEPFDSNYPATKVSVL
jgi:sterol-4alpha-carboxylate 3-dehydrogenase (decarboxylating)